MTKKEVKVTVVSFEEYTEYDFVDLSTFFFKDAMETDIIAIHQNGLRPSVLLMSLVVYRESIK